MYHQRVQPIHYLLLSLCWAATISYLSHQPGSGPDEITPWLPGEIKNLLHLPIFGLFALLLWLGIKHHFQNIAWAFVAVLSLTAAFGTLDEWHQSFIPGRTASIEDIAADLVGGMIALSVALYWQKHKPQKNRTNHG
ncbi:MAG: VanZ family protein [Candidatus Sedimenticola sp. (ex Thyasira tokunagai)]